MRGRLKTREHEHRLAIITAWHSAAWGTFSRKLPPLHKALGRDAPPKRLMSPEELAANLRRWKARLKAHGKLKPEPGEQA